MNAANLYAPARGELVGEGGKAAEMGVVRERYREQQGGLDTSGVAVAELKPRTGGLGGRICRCGRVCGAANAPFPLPEAQRLVGTAYNAGRARRDDTSTRENCKSDSRVNRCIDSQYDLKTRD